MMARQLPGAIAAKGGVELAVPGLLACLAGSGAGRFVGVDHPGTAEVAVAAVLEGGEEHGVDRKLGVFVEIGDDAARCWRSPPAGGSR